jgi:mannitol/fructose-specific phosphotransferase system IIA component (Ntr-type)
MSDDALVDAIRLLTDAIFPGDRGASGRLAAELSAVARKEPIELSRGILLLHAHAHGVSMPTLAVGARRAGWPLVALPTPVEIVVILVSPMDAGPEIHLEALTQVALAFRNLGLAERLLGDDNG